MSSMSIMYNRDLSVVLSISMGEINERFRVFREHIDGMDGCIIVIENEIRLF
jgi:hypothetical protein